MKVWEDYRTSGEDSLKRSNHTIRSTSTSLIKCSLLTSMKSTGIYIYLAIIDGLQTVYLLAHVLCVCNLFLGGGLIHTPKIIMPPISFMLEVMRDMCISKLNRPYTGTLLHRVID